MSQNETISALISANGGRLISTILILVTATVIKIGTNTLIRIAFKKLNDVKRATTLKSIIKNSINVAIFFTSLVMILSRWGINVAPILAGAGVVGLAVGFGAQTLVRDTINGFFVLLENTYNIGDRIKIAGLEGEVIMVNLRTTVLKDKEGATHTVPNSQISTVTKFHN